MIKGKRFKPNSIVSFFTETGKLVARSKGEEGQAIGGDVVSITTESDLEADAGTFSIVLTAKNRWDKVLASNDLVLISMSRGGNESANKSSVMVGLIDDVRKGTSISANSVQRQVTVTGRTLAKALINFEVGVVQEVEMTTASLGWLDGRINFNGISSAEIVKAVMKELVFKYMDYKFSTGAKLSELIKLKLSSRKGEKSSNDKSFSNFQGSMQSFLKEIVDEPFNQLFWEVYDGVPTLVERPTPFNKSAWEDLPLHTITDEDVVTDEIGRSDIETYVLYSVGLQSFFSAADVNSTTGVKPLWHEPYFKKYGLRRLNRFTSYVVWGNTDTTDKLKQYQKDLYNWNILNPTFFNGTITVKGQNYYKLGDRLLYKSVEDGTNTEFFIEGVSHEFVNFSHWITRLSVTRGLPKSGADRFKAPWGSAKEYAGGALGTPVGSSDGQNTGDYSGWDMVFPTGLTNGNTSQLLSIAKQFLNVSTKYVFGGGRTQSDILNNRFDCSSWVRYVFELAGYNLGPMGSTTTDTLARKGTAVNSIVALQPGDLVFWNTYKHNGHVGIYLGGGQAIACNTSNGVSTIDMNGSYWKGKLSSTMRRIII